MTSFRLAAAICTLVASTSPLSAQRGDEAVARHRAVYSAVEHGLSSFQRATATMDTLGLDRQSTDGGRLRAFCQRDTVRLFVADYYGETGDATYRYYLDHDSLIFVLAERRRGRPNGRDPYPKRTIVEHERFYFSVDRLVRWLGNKNIPKRVTSAEARERASDLLTDVRSFKAVMPACHPKYAP
jgi:hypothetical protein